MRAPLLRRLALLAIGLGTATVADAAQLRVAPGPLSRAHAALEGVGNCGSCHDAGQALSAARCLSCHKPIAERITQKRGVHRAVTDDCSPCHAEHAGTQADLRRFDTRAFDHADETGFALEGRHAHTASNCAA